MNNTGQLQTSRWPHAQQATPIAHSREEAIKLNQRCYFTNRNGKTNVKVRVPSKYFSQAATPRQPIAVPFSSQNTVETASTQSDSRTVVHDKAHDLAPRSKPSKTESTSLIASPNAGLASSLGTSIPVVATSQSETTIDRTSEIKKPSEEVKTSSELSKFPKSAVDCATKHLARTHESTPSEEEIVAEIHKHLASWAANLGQAHFLLKHRPEFLTTDRKKIDEILHDFGQHPKAWGPQNFIKAEVILREVMKLEPKLSPLNRRKPTATEPIKQEETPSNRTEQSQKTASPGRGKRLVGHIRQKLSNGKGKDKGK